MKAKTTKAATATRKAQKYPEMIFEKIYGDAVARLPWNELGPIHADGRRYMTIAQTAKHFGRTEAEWRNLWINVWGRFIPDDWDQSKTTTTIRALPEDVRIAMQYAATLERIRDDMGVFESHDEKAPAGTDLKFYTQDVEAELQSARDAFYRYVSDRLGFGEGRRGARLLSKHFWPGEIE